MKKSFCIASIVAAAALFPALPQTAKNPFAGRWDMTVVVGNDRFPSWIEVTDKGGALDARVQQRTGNVAPVAAVKMDGQRLIVTVIEATPNRPEIVWELSEQGGKLTGVQKMGGTTWQLSGVRAPALKRAAPAAWSDPEPLFDAKDLTGWQPINNTPEALNGHFASHWTVQNGELTNTARGSNLRTTRTFGDFKLHVEFNIPPDENSGVYLRGRYETQVAPPNSAHHETGAPRGAGFQNPFGFTGCVYGMAGPSAEPAFKPDWQTYDITLVGRWATVVFNGVTTVDHKEIAGVTGGAIDSNEGDPGPIYLQGDHHGGIHYRNVTISVPKQ